MEQYYDAIIWYHLVAPFYDMCVPGFKQHTPETAEKFVHLLGIPHTKSRTKFEVCSSSSFGDM